MPSLLGREGWLRDISFALVIARVCHPVSKLATTGRWADPTLIGDLCVVGAITVEVNAAMDWLAGWQEAIEAGLDARHRRPAGLRPRCPRQHRRPQSLRGPGRGLQEPIPARRAVQGGGRGMITNARVKQLKELG